MPFQTGGAAGGVTTLSDLQIDVDKDWKAHGIYNLGDLTPKVDGTYNLGSPTAQFDTMYGGLTDNAVTPPKLASDSIYKRHLRTGVVDTSYLTDNAATTAKVDPSVDLEFVRSNDNVIAGDIDAKVDGAYNLGSSANKFDTAYANNFPGTASISTESGNLTSVKGVKFRADGNLIGAVFKDPPNKANQGPFWVRQYSSKAAFEAIKSGYVALPQAFGSSNAPVVSPGNPTVNPEGGTNLFSVSFVPDGTQVDKFGTPGATPYGLTWDGTYLWNSDSDADYIYQLKTDGTQAGGFASPEGAPYGLTWDGTYLWNQDNSADYIYQLKTDGTQVGGFASPASDVRGLAWDGTYLWAPDFTATYIYQLKTDGTQVGGFASPGPGPIGLTWDGTYLWNTDYTADYIYQLKTDGTQAGGFASFTTSPAGLAWDGIYLWDLDDDIIYRVGSASSMDIAYQVTSVS